MTGGVFVCLARAALTSVFIHLCALPSWLQQFFIILAFIA